MTVQRTQLTLHQGPLPPPDQLEAYERLLPGGADRIFRKFEEQASHRMALERFVAEAETRRANFGLVAAFVIAMTGVTGGTLVALAGHEWAGAAIVGADLVSLVGVFVYGSQTRKDERLRKMRLLAGQPEQSE